MCAKSQLGTFVFVYLEDLVFRGYTPFVNVLILKIYPWGLQKYLGYLTSLQGYKWHDASYEDRYRNIINYYIN